MSEGSLQLLGPGLLVAGVAMVWIYNARRGLDLSPVRAKAFLLLAALAIVGGFVGATAWWIDHPASFSWDLPPLASRLLAAAAFAFGVSGFMVLRKPTAAHVRYYALMIAVYLGPLALAIVLVHRDRFDFALPITRAFFAIVVPMTLVSLWLALRPVSLATAADAPSGEPDMRVKALLALVIAVFGPWAVALFALDAGPSPLVWVWPGDLLTSRLIAVMPLTLALTALVSWRSAVLAMTTLVLVAVYGLGGAAAGLMNAVAGKKVPLLYVMAFGAFGLAAAWRLVATRRPTGP